MTELETIMLDVTNTLNHNGHDEVTVDSRHIEGTAVVSPRCTDCDFTVRVGYWERIDGSLLETIGEYHSVRINEHIIEDEDCGELFRYVVEVVDEASDYTPEELNELDSNYGDEDSYLAEDEFLHKYESGDIWGVA